MEDYWGGIEWLSFKLELNFLDFQKNKGSRVGNLHQLLLLLTVAFGNKSLFPQKT